MSSVNEILTAFEEALELERELGTRTVEIDRALLRCSPAPIAAPARGACDSGENNHSGSSSGSSATSGSRASSSSSETRLTETANDSSAAGARVDFAFLLEGDPQGPVAELLPKMSEAIGYGPMA